MVLIQLWITKKVLKSEYPEYRPKDLVLPETPGLWPPLKEKENKATRLRVFKIMASLFQFRYKIATTD